MSGKKHAYAQASDKSLRAEVASVHADSKDGSRDEKALYQIGRLGFSFDDLISVYKKHLDEATSEEKRLELQQEINTHERQSRQWDPEYIRKRDIMFSGCAFAESDHFKSALESPVSDVGSLEVVAKRAHWRGGEAFGDERPKREITQFLKAQQRGDYWIATIDEALLAKRWIHFKYELLAFNHDYNFESRPRGSVMPVFPAFSMRTFALYATNSIPQYHYFQACRITHRLSPIEIRIHSCAKHTNLIEIRGLSLSDSSNKDLDLLNEALRFFWYKQRIETRVVHYPEYGGDHRYEVAYEAGDGRPTGAKTKAKKQYSKTSLIAELDKAIRKLGDRATQDNVAQLIRMGTSKTLYRERVRLNVAPDWKGYVREVLDR